MPAAFLQHRPIYDLMLHSACGPLASLHRQCCLTFRPYSAPPNLSIPPFPITLIQAVEETRKRNPWSQVPMDPAFILQQPHMPRTTSLRLHLIDLWSAATCGYHAPVSEPAASLSQKRQLANPESRLWCLCQAQETQQRGGLVDQLPRLVLSFSRRRRRGRRMD